MKEENDVELKSSSQLLKHCYNSIDGYYFDFKVNFERKLILFFENHEILAESSTRNTFIEEVNGYLDLIELVLVREQFEKSEQLLKLTEELHELQELIVDNQKMTNELKELIKFVKKSTSSLELRKISYQNRNKKYALLFHSVEEIYQFQQNVEFVESLLEQNQLHTSSETVLSLREQFEVVSSFACLKSYSRRLEEVKTLCMTRLKTEFCEFLLKGEFDETEEFLRTVELLSKFNFLRKTISFYSATSCEYLKASVSECISQSSDILDLVSLVVSVLERYLSRNKAIESFFKDSDYYLTASSTLKALVKSSVKQLLNSLLLDKEFSLQTDLSLDFVNMSNILLELLQEYNIQGVDMLRSDLKSSLLKHFNKLLNFYLKTIENSLDYEQWLQVEVPQFVQDIVNNDTPIGLSSFIQKVEQLCPNSVPNPILHVQKQMNLKSSGRELSLNGGSYRAIGSCLVTIFILYRINRILNAQTLVSTEYLETSVSVVTKKYSQLTIDMLLNAKACISSAKLKKITTRNLALGFQSLNILQLYLTTTFSSFDVSPLVQILDETKTDIKNKLIFLINNLLQSCFDVKKFSYQMKRIINGLTSLNSTLTKVLRVELTVEIFKEILDIVKNTMLEYLKRILIDKSELFQTAQKKSELRSSMSEFLSGLRRLPNLQLVSDTICNEIEAALNNCLEQLKQKSEERIRAEKYADIVVPPEVKLLVDILVQQIEIEHS